MISEPRFDVTSIEWRGKTLQVKPRDEGEAHHPIGRGGQCVFLRTHPRFQILTERLWREFVVRGWDCISRFDEVVLSSVMFLRRVLDGWRRPPCPAEIQESNQNPAFSIF